MKKQLNKWKWFTLVELIVIITILAILWTISFIALQGFAVNARDAKRTIDVKNLIWKINIEQTRGVNISDLIITDPHNIIINWTWAKSHQWIANFVNLKENEENFKDPLNKNQDYLLARASGEWYNFLQWATINETNETAVIMWSYYKINEEKDSESLFEIDWIILENWKTPMTYPLGW
jgi:Tfp pilus assembly protein FimT